MSIDNLIPIAEYAARIGLTANAIRQRCKRGTLPAVKIGRDWFIPADTKHTDSRVKSGEYRNWRNKSKEGKTP